MSVGNLGKRCLAGRCRSAQALTECCDLRIPDVRIPDVELNETAKDRYCSQHEL